MPDGTNNTPTPKEIPTIRTPYESAPPPFSDQPYPVTTPQIRIEAPQIGRMQSEKILKEIRRERMRSVKRGLLVFLLILTAAGSGFGWSRMPLVWFVSTVLFISLFPLVISLTRWITVAIISPVLAALLFLPFIQSTPLWPIVLTIGGAALFLFFSALFMRAKAGNLVNFRIAEVFGAGSKLLIVAIAIIYSSAYYYTILPQKVSQERFFISEQTFNNILAVIAKIARPAIPNFRPDMTVDEFIAQLLNARRESLLRPLKIDPAYQEASDTTKRQMETQIISKARQELFAQLSKSLGRTLGPRDTFSKVLWESLTAMFKNLTPGTQRFTAIIWGSSALLILIFLGALLTSIFSFISWVLLELLLSFRFLEMSREITERKIPAI